MQARVPVRMLPDMSQGMQTLPIAYDMTRRTCCAYPIRRGLDDVLHPSLNIRQPNLRCWWERDLLLYSNATTPQERVGILLGALDTLFDVVQGQLYINELALIVLFALV